MHTPVLLEKAIEGLAIQPDCKYIDATAGEGGHASMIAHVGGTVLALDWDSAQIENLKSKLADRLITFAQANYADIEKVAAEHGFVPADGVLFDFGLSMKQLSTSGKGFSYKQVDQPLDMRIDSSLEVTAADIINSFSEEELYETFAHNAEEFHSLSIAQSIVFARIKRKFKTVGDLVQVIQIALTYCKMSHPHGDSVYSRIFQALRIEVNNEFENIRNGLEGAVKVLRPGGRIVTIAFHSLEDRIVKQFIKNNTSIRQTHKHAVHGDSALSFERSAKLRIIEKI